MALSVQTSNFSKVPDARDIECQFIDGCLGRVLCGMTFYNCCYDINRNYREKNPVNIYSITRCYCFIHEISFRDKLCGNIGHF